MSWQAFYQDAVNRDGRIVFSIVYTDGITKTLREYTVDALSDDVVKQTARNEVARLSQVATDVGKVSIAAGTAIDLTPPVVSAPVDPDPARTQFFADYRLLQAYQRGVAAGLIAVDDKTLAVQLATVQAEYLPAYAGSL